MYNGLEIELDYRPMNMMTLIACDGFRKEPHIP